MFTALDSRLRRNIERGVKVVLFVLFLVSVVGMYGLSKLLDRSEIANIIFICFCLLVAVTSIVFAAVELTR
jgi:hypothetical protein